MLFENNNDKTDAAAMAKKAKAIRSAIGDETLATGAYLQTFRQVNQELLNDLDSMTMFPVSAEAFFDLYRTVYGIVSIDDNDLKFTRSIAAIYGDVNEDMSEFWKGFINPMDPLNW